MFCSNCGSQIGEGEKFCKVCGTPVNGQAAAPVMQQAPVNQQPVSEQPVPAPKSGRPYGPQERKKANRLCIISLILGVVVPLATSILFAMAENLISGTDIYYISSLVSIPASAAVIAGIALMIVVRVKYRKSKFGLVLMIIYCVYVVAAVLMLLFALSSCSDFIGSSSCS